VHVADLANPQDVKRLAMHLREVPCVMYLVNNAGFGTMGTFANVGLERHLDMVRVHVLAPIELTHAVLPQMVARGNGYIINVSSMSAFLVGPGQVTYAATKSLLKSFSESLQAELRGTGVRVQAVCPGMTYTGFHDTAEFKDFDRSQLPKGLWMSAEAVVEASLRDLKRGRVVCVPGLKNKLLARLFSVGAIRAIAGKVVQKKPKP